MPATSSDKHIHTSCFLSSLAASLPPALPLQTQPEMAPSRKRSLWIVSTLSPSPAKYT